MRPILLAALALALVPASAAQETLYALDMQNYDYLPPRLDVPPGVTVRARNLGSTDPAIPAEPHTITSSTDRSLFDVQNIPPDGSPREFTAPSVPGEYPFYCIYHGAPDGQGMAGVLVVTSEAASPTSSPPSPATSPAPSPSPTAATPMSIAVLLLAMMIGALAARRK